MILTRYNDPSHVLNLSVDYGLEMILKAREKETERSAWEMWLTFDAEAKKKTPFSEFLDKLKQPDPQANTRTDDEVLQDAESIIKLMKRSE